MDFDSKKILQRMDKEEDEKKKMDEMFLPPFFIILAVGIALYLLVLMAEIYLLIQGRSIKYEGE